MFRFNDESSVNPVACPGGFSGCPETPPPAMIFLIGQGVTPLLAPHQPLTFATFGNSP